MCRAVVHAIHVLAPYRNELGTIPFSEWLRQSLLMASVVGLCPFILISGALMLKVISARLTPTLSQAPPR